MTEVFIFLALAILAMVGGVLLIEDLRLMRSPRRETTGEVYDHRRSLDDGSVYYVALVRYRDQHGMQHEFEDTFGRSYATPPIGFTVKVVHSLAAPHVARIPRPMLRTSLYAFVGTTGTILLARLFGWLAD